MEQINTLRSEFMRLSPKNAKLKQQVTKLTQKLTVLNESHKASPFGTSMTKGLRPKPSLIPDESLNPSLAKILTEVATHKVLIVALVNLYVKTMLKLWFSSIKKAGIMGNNVPVYQCSSRQ